MDIEFEGTANHDLTCASHSAAPLLSGSEDMVVARRRHERWPTDERARITAESFEPGTSISEVARRNGVSLGLLHYWRRQARDSGRVEELRFVPITVAPEPTSVSAGAIEIELADACIRVSGVVDAALLRAVLAAVRA
jgi:transposase